MSTCSPRETKFGSNSAGKNQKETDAEGFGQLISRSCFRLLFACTSKHPPWKRSTAPANTKGKRLEGFGLGLPGKKEDDGIMGEKKRPKHIGRCLLHFLVREKKSKSLSVFLCFSYSRALLAWELLILNLYFCRNPPKHPESRVLWAGDKYFLKPLPDIEQRMMRAEFSPQGQNSIIWFKDN